MTNPYKGKPSYQFWRSAVSTPLPSEVDPIVSTKFLIHPDDKIATAGSCFAQHIARTLVDRGWSYFVVEDQPATDGAEHENYGTFSARFGNVYTVRQLLQLFRRAYGTFEPEDRSWIREDGRYIDPFRPAIQAAGFTDIAALEADRAVHLDAVRTMFEDCGVFIFTLGLTEAWLSNSDGAVFPLAPGTVASSPDIDSYGFHNFTVTEMEADLASFVRCLKGVNPGVRIILTVSPVPLVATFEPRHVLVSTTYSKAALRVVAEQIAQSHDDVEYFPSYEMITGPHSRGAYFGEDLREILPDGVAYVMGKFAKHYLDAHAEPASETTAQVVPRLAIEAEAARVAEVSTIICDEELIEGSVSA